MHDCQTVQFFCSENAVWSEVNGNVQILTSPKLVFLSP